jgi:hypothetical protein
MAKKTLAAITALIAFLVLAKCLWAYDKDAVDPLNPQWEFGGKFTPTQEQTITVRGEQDRRIE